MEFEQGDVVLCSVERIEKTIVFVKILEGNEDVEGSIVMSEIAPGRIRNIRDYVVPNKKIVCKVLRVLDGKHIELSLRRVTHKEHKEVLDRHNQERSYVSMLKTVLGDKAEDAIKRIKEEESVYDFFQEARENPDKLKNILGKEDAEKVLEILESQRSRKAVLRKEIYLKVPNSNGLEELKNLLSTDSAEVKYVSAGRYSLKAEADDIKKADNILRDVIANIEKGARKAGAEFAIKEK